MTLTKKQKNGIIISLVFAVLISISIYFYCKSKAIPEIKNPETGQKLSTGSAFSDTLNDNLVLKKGDAGNNVRELQKAVNSKIKEFGANINTLVEDGVYGNATDKAVKAISSNTYYSNNVTTGKIKAILKGSPVLPVEVLHSGEIKIGDAVRAAEKTDSYSPILRLKESSFEKDEYIGVVSEIGDGFTSTGFALVLRADPSGGLKKELVYMSKIYSIG